MRPLLVILFLPALHAASSIAAAESALDRANYAEAARVAHELLAAEPRNAKAHVVLGRAWIGRNDAPHALDELAAALRADPKNLDALYYLNRLSSVLARQEFARLYAMAPESARVHQLMAESLHEQDDAAGEEREYLAALEKNPHSVSVLNALGELKRHQSRLEAAAGYYARAAAIDPLSFDALYGLGACAIFGQDNPQAIAYLSRALVVDPQSIATRLALGDALLRDKQNQRAVDVLQGLVATDPSAKQAWVLLAKALRGLGRKEEADRAFARYRVLAQQEADAQ